MNKKSNPTGQLACAVLLIIFSVALAGGKQQPVDQPAYVLHLPANIPAAIFWSVTLYDPITASELDNGQTFPSINTMDKPIINADGSTDIYFGSKSPGEGKNYLATLPGQGWFTLLRLYGPKKAFFDQTWKPDGIEKIP